MGPETCPIAVSVHLQQQLALWGLDIVHPFTPQLFNAHCPTDNALPTFGRTTTAGLLIGNSRQLWSPFLHHLAAHPEQLSAANPLDDYIQTAVAASLAACGLTVVPEADSRICAAPPEAAAGSCQPCTSPNKLSTVCMHQEQQQQEQGNGTRCHVRYSHSSGALFVNVLRVAELSRLAYYSPVTHLCLHPTYGPWFALRAVVLLDLEAGPDFLAAAPVSCFPVADVPSGTQQQQQEQGQWEQGQHGQEQQQQGQGQQQQDKLQEAAHVGPLPCPYPELEAEAGAAMAALQAAGGLATWQQHWQDWAGLRRLAGRHVGSQWEYSPEQLVYHYTKDRALLQEAVAEYQLQLREQGEEEREV